jgi:hypothetical protein
MAPRITPVCWHTITRPPPKYGVEDPHDAANLGVPPPYLATHPAGARTLPPITPISPLHPAINPAQHEGGGTSYPNETRAQ